MRVGCVNSAVGLGRAEVQEASAGTPMVLGARVVEEDVVEVVDEPSMAARVQQRIGSWPGVRVIPSQDRGMRFCTPRGEFLHFHGEVQMDVRLNLPDRDAVLAGGMALFHPRAHEGGWVILRLDSCSFRVAIRLAAAAYRACLNRGS